MEPNATRARRCAKAITRYGDDLAESNLIDFLADAMHFCDAEGMDFQILFAQACRHYVNELNDDQQDERRMIP
jgi:tyrosine-protein phosphatase YwqE